MRNLFLSAFFVLVLIANTNASSKNNIVNKETVNAYLAQSNFNARYRDAQNAVWSQENGLHKVSFLLDGVKKVAYFDFSGAYLATSQYITVDELSSLAKEKIKRYYKNFTPGEVLRYETEESGNVFFVSLRKEDAQLVIKVTSDDEISFFKNL